MRVASLVEQAQAAHDRRSALYQSYEDAINKYKSTKDVALFGTNRKKIDGDHKTLSQQIGNIQSKLKAEAAEAADKVSWRLAARWLLTGYSICHFQIYCETGFRFSEKAHLICKPETRFKFSETRLNPISLGILCVVLV